MAHIIGQKRNCPFDSDTDKVSTLLVLHTCKTMFLVRQANQVRTAY